MPTAKARLMRRIRRYMSIWAYNVGLDNKVGLTDINKAAEDFYCGLLNILLDVKLKNMNLLKMDFPAIDLADVNGRVCVQVTSTAGREKIDHTLEKFYEHKLDGKDLKACFDRLIVAIIGEKKKYRPFPKHESFIFDPDRDVWDTPRLLLEIEALEMDRLKKVDAYLEEQLGAQEEETVPLNLPMRTAMNAENFVGREKELAEIAERFETERIVVLSGLGGMGKTELAVRYGQQYAQTGRGAVYFVHFRQDFFHTVTDEIAPVLPGLTEQGLDENGKYREVMKVLKTLGREDILILDNADQANFSALRRELNGLPMKVLVTTRMDVAKAVPVAALNREELYAIFEQQEVDISREEMDELIDAVEGHTLTVDVMARTMRRGRRAATAEKLLAALKDRDLSRGFTKVEIDYAGSPEQARINEHLKAVFRVAGLTEEEREVLRFATLLPQNGIDDELFLCAVNAKKPVKSKFTELILKLLHEDMGEQDENAGSLDDLLAGMLEELQADPDAASDTLDDLIDKGWLTKEALLKIHPIIRIVCIEELEPTDENCGAFLYNLDNKYDPNHYDMILYRQWAEVFTEASVRLADAKGDWALRAGHFWWKLGEAAKALDCETEMVRKLEKRDPDSKALATAYNNLGSTYGDLGDHEKALEYKLKDLAICERVLPKDHPDLATSYNNVGSTYGDLGDHEKALEYKLKALEICERVLPKDHPNLASSYNNVGTTYGALGDHQKALEYKLKDLAICERVLPKDHPDLATSYNNVGGTYRAMGDYKKTLEYVLKALEIRERVLPEDHPNRASSYDNVGVTYGALGDHVKELEYKLKGLEIRERVLPRDHPDLALSCGNIAFTYACLDDFQTASQYIRWAVEIAEKRLPEGHPNLENYRQGRELIEMLAIAQEMGIEIPNPFKE